MELGAPSAHRECITWRAQAVRRCQDPIGRDYGTHALVGVVCVDADLVGQRGDGRGFRATRDTWFGAGLCWRKCIF